MRLVWDIEYDYEEAYVIGVREGLARWWRAKRDKKKLHAERRSEAIQIIDMAPIIAMLDPDTSAFETMMMRLPGYKWPVQTVTWLEDELMPRVASVGLWGEWDWIDPKPTTKHTITLAAGWYGENVQYGTVLRNAKTGEASRVLAVVDGVAVAER